MFHIDTYKVPDGYKIKLFVNGYEITGVKTMSKALWIAAANSRTDHISVTHCGDGKAPAIQETVGLTSEKIHDYVYKWTTPFSS